MAHNQKTAVWTFQNRRKEFPFYKDEKSPEIRCQLLRLLARESCAWALDIPRLIRDSGSTDSQLSETAFGALICRRDAAVRTYALALIQNEQHLPDAISMLAANYEAKDRELLTSAVKQIPITSKNGEWHMVFSALLDLFKSPAKGKPRELLPYMYQNTLCSFCRGYIVMEMGRRRMITRELLTELQYDCNEKIRSYACKKLHSL